MNFFDDLINQTNECLSGFEEKLMPLDSGWQDVGRSEVILQRDSAFELDGVGFNLVTSKAVEEGIAVIGDDLGAISSDRPFARISLIQIDDVGDEQTAYNIIRKVEYAKYHYFPKGYMNRNASDNHKEVVRLSKSALEKGLNFQQAGSLLAKKYKENPAVKAVKIIYVTDKSVDYSALERIAKKNYSITETLNHIMNNITYDCDSCKLKVICDEVEGMRELHFKNSGMK